MIHRVSWNRFKSYKKFILLGKNYQFFVGQFITAAATDYLSPWKKGEIMIGIKGIVTVPTDIARIAFYTHCSLATLVQTRTALRTSEKKRRRETLYLGYTTIAHHRFHHHHRHHCRRGRHHSQHHHVITRQQLSDCVTLKRLANRLLCCSLRPWSLSGPFPYTVHSHPRIVLYCFNTAGRSFWR